MSKELKKYVSKELKKYASKELREKKKCEKICEQGIERKKM